MADDFATISSALDSPGKNAAAVTPSDSADLGTSCRALWIGTPGNIKVTTVGGDIVTFNGMSGWFPVRCARIWSTGTTASGIVAVW
ncbi:spike base protein, RCAP_Rcc01079 family [Prosthecomicrobium hirschii]|uniref:spike base protein, RCAP_Rcc01079 family n=1 Tax=Prosthecodimorpha hirschii TaxID=665126 RepID=UPI00221FB2B7|nr:hypothetical protein [Prosthecomicrobium hirschii]MCW1844114.1 hypothetical protein [Prosthecomicrobium hirschii]